MLVATCPHCKSAHQLSSRPKGIHACSCGAGLFIVTSKPGDLEIPVQCSGCGERYDVDADDSGEEMECECGADVRVPTLVIAKPAARRAAKPTGSSSSSTQKASTAAAKQSRKPQPTAAAAPATSSRSKPSAPKKPATESKSTSKTPDRASSGSGTWKNRASMLSSRATKASNTGKASLPDSWQPISATETPSGEDEIQCPKCKEAHAILPEWKGNSVQCTCGHTFQIPGAPSGPAVTPPTVQPPAAAPSEKPAARRKKEKQQEDDSEESGGKERSKKGISTFEIVGASIVGIVLLASILLFFIRPGSRVAEAEQTEPEDAGGQTDQGLAAESTSDVAMGPGKAADEAVQAAGGGGVLDNDLQMAISPQLPDITKRQTEPAIATVDPGPVSAIDLPREPTSQRNPKPARAVIPIIASKSMRGLKYDVAYETAYESYQEFQKLNGDSPGADDTKQALGKAIGLFQECLKLAGSSASRETRLQLLYTLGYLHFRAGYLYEASVFAEQAVRMSKADDNQVGQEATMIAVAALQEAFHTQFGDKNSPGEVQQIVRLAGLAAERWPDFDKLDVIWYSAAQLLEQDQYYLDAAQAYTKISTESPKYPSAQIAAGRCYRSETLLREKHRQLQQIEVLIANAAKHFATGINKTHATEVPPTKILMAAKLSLAQIALRRGNHSIAIKQLKDDATGILTLASDQASDDGQQIQMSGPFVTATYESLFSAYQQSGNVRRLYDTLQVLGDRYGPAKKKQIDGLRIQIIKDFVADLRRRRCSTEDAQKLQEMLQPLTDAESGDTNFVLWTAQSWRQLGETGASKDAMSYCHQQSVALLKRLAENPDTDSGTRLAIELDLVDSLRASGEYEESMKIVESILEKQPSAISMQIQAVETLAALAEASGSVTDYEKAINGIEGSPIWGCKKLANNLINLNFSGDQSDDGRDRMLRVIHMLASTRIKYAGVLSDAARKQQILKDTVSAIQKAKSTLVPSGNPWGEKLESLRQTAQSQLPGSAT